MIHSIVVVWGLLLIVLSVSSMFFGADYSNTIASIIIAASWLTNRCIDMLFTNVIGARAILNDVIALSSNIGIVTALLCIELFSGSFRSLSLGFRYTANATAGHILIHISCSAILMILQVSVATLAICILVLTLFECAVASIQVFIYTVLISTYANS